LGQALNDARLEAGLSIRQLAAAADVPKSEVDRLLRDEQERLNPDSLIRLAEVLELRAADLFLLAGLALPDKLPSVEALLRTEYDLPDAAVREARAHIDAIVARYQRSKKPTNTKHPKGGKQ
jgi:transcriptional regulator with XRE-family HTH domain